ncbi:MAG: zinc ribbon domain-containing protein, partial [Thermoplasmata archaeon]
SPIAVMVYWTTPGNDINLYLRDPGGVLVESSESLTGYEETLLYIPPTTGTYVLEVYGADIGSASMPFTGTCLYHQISLQTGSGGLLWVLIIAVIVIVVVVLLLILLLVVRKKPVSQFPPPAYGAQQPVQQYPYQQPPQQYPYQPQAQQYSPAQAPQSPPAQQTSRSCPYCGTALDPTWLVCPKCGARI